MPLIIWNEEYELGIREIDSQHKQLVDLVNVLHYVCSGHAESQEEHQKLIDKVLTSLIDYTQRHFQFEEKVLKSSGYPDYLSHKESHSRMVDIIRKHHKAFEEGNGNSEELLMLLLKWLTSHILNTDKKYVKHLLKKGFA